MQLLPHLLRGSQKDSDGDGGRVLRSACVEGAGSRKHCSECGRPRLGAPVPRAAGAEGRAHHAQDSSMSRSRLLVQQSPVIPNPPQALKSVRIMHCRIILLAVGPRLSTANP